MLLVSYTCKVGARWPVEGYIKPNFNRIIWAVVRTVVTRPFSVLQASCAVPIRIITDQTILTTSVWIESAEALHLHFRLVEQDVVAFFDSNWILV